MSPILLLLITKVRNHIDIEVTAESTDGSSTTQVYTIDVLDFNEFAITQVTDNDTGANEVSEAALAGTVVGVTAFAEDLDLSHNVTYAITSDPSGAFEIDTDSGVVTLATTGVLDFETVPSVDLEITATSDDGSSSIEIFTINILDANEAGVGPISDTNPAADQVSEDAVNGSFVGITAFADDPDTTDQVTYSLSNNAGGAFAINATTGEVSVADTDLIDYESDQSLEIEVTAESTDGSSTTQVYTINVLDFNEFAITQITDSDTSANEVSEAALAGTVVGLTAFAEDADLSANVTYEITNDPSGAFEIDEQLVL